jgi:hypothetical protein
MLNLCGIVVAILKMAIGRHFSMSGHHYVPTYQILMISMLNFCGIVVAILKMATSRNFSMLNFYRLFFMLCFGSHLKKWQTSRKF